ncbi:hypothetical protein M8Z33_13755 [Streptomyces sp. ZAF1911]|uniref:hypothetical protein n=1 Tax=Streptomyces sp. ZAF1911 TaxID=2944129 RepID=UPI00237B52EF|nr:hypothetical protein [Streptomyces sp. ZAF1911]MDD9377705.1 hypothetical protein [Streptomyces sp. ZAF1911]
MSAAERPWRERRVVDGLADALREAASERFLGNGRTPTARTPTAKAASAPAGASGAGRVVGKAGT